MPSPRRTLLGLGIVFLVVSPWKHTSGADITWSAPANGNWNVAANWSPPQVPGPADHAHITPTGSPTITLNVDARVARLTLGDGSGSPILAIPSSARRLNVSDQLAILPQATLRHGGILTNGLILVAGEFAWIGGTLEGSPTTPLRLNILPGGRLSLTNEAPRTLRHTTLHNAGIVRWSLGRVNAAAGDCRFLNEGLVEIDRATAGAWTVAAAGTTARIDNLPTGTFVKTGPSTATLDPDIVNQGTFQIDSGTLSAKASTGRYTQSSGRTVLNGGTLQAAGGIVVLGGVLEGHGTLAGPVQNSGTLRPGASPGELLLTSSLDLSRQSVLDLEIAGTASGLFDRIQVAGHTRRAGTVQVAFLDGFTPKAGDSFPFLVSPDGTSGRFDSFAAPAGPPWFDLIEHSQGARFNPYEGPSSLALRIESPPTLQITAEQRLSLPVTLSFPEGDVDAVTLSVTTPDPALIPPANVTLTGSGRARTLTVRPNRNGSGSTLLTLTATAPGGPTTAASITLQIAPAPVQGLQAYEPFDYPTDNPLTSFTTGSSTLGSVGFARPWTGSPIFRVERTSLAHPDLLTSGHHASATPRASIQTTARELASPIGTPGTTRYLSFLARADSLPAGGPSLPFFGILLDTSVNPDFFIGKPGQGAPTHWVIEDAGGAGQQAGPATINQGVPTLLVAKFEFEEGNDRVSLFVAPTPGGPEPTTPDAVRTDRDLGTVHTLALDASDAWSTDELRIGTTWESVVPNLTFLPPLALQTIPDFVAEEDTAVAGLRATLSGSIAPRVPVFQLTQAPAGMTMNPATGIMAWRPDESQGGQTFDVTVQVHDTPEPPTREATTHFRVTVREKNNPPQLALDPLSNLRATRGAPFHLKLGARDNDLPENTFTFEKSGTTPAGLNISPNGDLDWTPPANATPGLVTVSVRITDSNPLAPEATRSLSRVNTFNLEVVEPNADLVVEVVADGDSLRSSDSIPVGTSGTLHLRVTNRGPSPAPDVQLALHSQLLANNPPQVEFVSGQPSQGTCALEGDAVLCRFGSIAPLATADTRVTLRFRLQGQASFDLQARSAIPDLGPGNERRPIEIRVTAPAPTNPDDWEFTEIESLGITGNQVVMQEDRFSEIRFAWFNPSEQTIKYAMPSGEEWSVQTLQTQVVPPAGVYQDAAGRPADAVVDHQNLAMVLISEDPRFLFVHSSSPNHQRLALKSLHPSVTKDDPESFTIDEAPGADPLGSPVLLGTGSDAFIFYRRDDQLMRADVHLTLQDRGVRAPFYQSSQIPAPVPLEGWRLTRRGTAIAALNTETIVVSAAASDGLIRLIAVRDQRSSGGSVTVTPIDLIAENDLAVLHHSMARVGEKLAVAYERHLAGTDEIWLAEWDGLAWHREKIPIDPDGSHFCARPVIAAGDNAEVAAVCTEQSLDGNRRRWVRTWRVARRIQGVWQSEELFRSESFSEPLADGNPPPPVDQPLSPGLAYLASNSLRAFAAHTGWPTENLIYARRRPRWDLTSLAPSTPGVPVGSPAIALNWNQPSVAWTTETPSQTLRLNRAKRVNGLPESPSRTYFVTLDDPSGTAGNVLAPLTPGSYRLSDSPDPVVGWNLLNTDPATEKLQQWRIREGANPESPDLDWLPTPVPDRLHAAPGGSVLLPSIHQSHMLLTGVDQDRLPTVMRVPTDSIPPTFPPLVANTVSPRTSRLIRAAFAQGNPAETDDVVYAAYFAGGPPYSLRVAEFRDGHCTRDVLLGDVTDNFVGPQAIPLPTNELPWLAADWAIHPPSDTALAPGWLYVAYPHGLAGGEQTLRVLRVDLSLPNLSVQQVDMTHVPSPLRSLKGLRLRTVRESLRMAYTDGGHLYLGRCNGILDLNAVRDMTFETLPINDSVAEVDLAFEGDNTWLATRGTEQIIVSGMGRFPRTYASLSGDLYTPHYGPPSKEEDCFWTFAYLLIGAFRGPIDSDPQAAIHSTHSYQNHRRTQAPSTSPPTATSDLDALRAVRTVMLRTPEGQRLEALYRQFSPDAAAVIAANPKLLVDTLATVRNFLPGLIAYASGSGNRSIITRGMIDQLNNLWSGLANRGSPALKSALLAERDRFHGFEDFVGKSFDQWAEQLQFPKTATSGAPFRIVASERTAAGFNVTVEGLANSNVRLERTEQLGSGTWAPVVNSAITPDGNRVRLTDPAPPAGHAFYRITAIPSP